MNSGIGKIVIVALGMLVLVIAIGFIMNTVAVPASNAIWSGASNKRCDSDPTAKSSIVVIIPVFDKTAIPETKILLKRAFTTASCWRRVRVVLVAFGQDRSDILDLPLKLQKGLMFKGVQGFVVAERVQVVSGGEAMTGPLAAFAIGVDALLEDADYAVLASPSGELRSRWDRTLIDEVNTTPKPKGTVLTYAHTSDTMQNTTFPLLAVDGVMPTVRWMQYSRQPTECFTCKSLSPDFAFMHTSLLKTDEGKQVLSLLSNPHLACPPSFFGVFCAGLLHRAGVDLRTPKTLVTTPMRSLSMNNYRDALRSDMGRALATVSTNLTLKTMNDQLAGTAFESDILGVSLTGKTNTVEGIMGVSRRASDAEIDAKYGGVEELARQTEAARTKMGGVLI